MPSGPISASVSRSAAPGPKLSSSAYSPLTVQGSTSLKNATDRADRGRFFQAAVEQSRAEAHFSLRDREPAAHSGGPSGHEE